MDARDGRRGGRGRARAAAVAAGALCLALLAPAQAGAAGSKPSRRPSVPTGLTVVPGPGQLVISWSPPLYPGAFVNQHGVTVDYTITDYDLKGIPAKSWASCVDLDRTCTVTGLKTGHTYEVAVKVWNANGKHSPFSAPVPGTPT